MVEGQHANHKSQLAKPHPAPSTCTPLHCQKMKPATAAGTHHIRCLNDDCAGIQQHHSIAQLLFARNTIAIAIAIAIHHGVGAVPQEIPCLFA